MAENDEKLKRLKAIRSGNRAVITRYINETCDLLKEDGDSANTMERLRTIANLLNGKIERVRQLDSEILDLCDVSVIVQEIEESEDVYSRACDVQARIAKLTCRSVETISKSDVQVHETTNTGQNADAHEQTTSQVSQSSSTLSQSTNASTTQNTDTQLPSTNTQLPNTSMQIPHSDTLTQNTNMQFSNMSTNLTQHQPTAVRSKLPKLILPKFKGEVTNYRSFWEMFESAVHKNISLTNIDKFNYLMSLLEGQALRAIKGLAVTEENYQAALDILHERFGNTQQIISAHMDELLKLPPCNGEKSGQLRYIYDKVSVNVRGLEALGVRSEQYGSLLIPVIMSKLPADVRLQIARSTKNDVWVISDLLARIQKEVEARELSERVKTNNDFKKPGPTAKIIGSTASLTAQGTQAKGSFAIKCVFCGHQHYSASCGNITKLGERKNILRRDGRCFVCLQFGHRGNQCSKKCRQCSGKHHQSICEKRSPGPRDPGTEQEPNQSENTSVKTASTSTEDHVIVANQTVTAAGNSRGSKRKIFLQTATTQACAQGNQVPVRILMDSGSQRTYITDTLKNKLELVPEKTELLNLNTFGNDQVEQRKCDKVKLQLKGRSRDIGISALSLPKICAPLTEMLDVDDYPHLEGLQLADDHLIDNNETSSDIDILIGSDYYYDIITGEIQRGDVGPCAVNSEFGWLICGSGKAKTPGRDEIVANFVAERNDVLPNNLIFKSDHEDLNEVLSKFWTTDSIGITDDADVVKGEFLTDIRYKEDESRYEVSLPWKEGCQIESNGYSQCVKRLDHVFSRLKGEPELLKEYDNVIKEQLQAGIIERVVDSNLDDAHYLPHHGVTRHDKKTTKLRVVFDGSAKHGEGSLSINECLEKGPNLVPHLFDTIISFRGYPIGIASDVEKAFHQISINPTDRRKLRFLWYDDVTKTSPQIVHYQFCRLVFGLTPSPAILSSLLEYHFESHAVDDPETVSILKDSFYVDDLITGAWDDSGAIEIYEKSNKIMKDGGFKLRKWSSNSTMFQERVAKDEKMQASGANNMPKSIDENNMNDRKTLSERQCSAETEQGRVKVLGMTWNVKTDRFEYDFSKLLEYMKSLPVTKRSVLKLSAKIFDPLGFLSPFTIALKILFQSLCVEGVVWDDALRDTALEAWNGVINDLSSIRPFTIPRCYFSLTNRPLVFEIHGFSDASCKAYAAVVYLRTVYIYGGTDVKLVASKTRVATVKKQSIPRLELLGAVILARLVSCVQRALTSLPSISRVVLWSDSFTVLCWIRNRKAWKTYVQNRVMEILSLTKAEEWKFCPGENNPVDMPSRGCKASDLLTCEEWWCGPHFLKLNEEHWPTNPDQNEREYQHVNEELSKPKPEPQITRALTNASAESKVNLNELIDCTQFSSKTKLLRVTAYVMRFISIVKRIEHSSGELRADELRNAEKLWLRSVQYCCFQEEHDHLSGLNTKECQLVKQLGLFQDEEGIIRCQGRINQSSAPQTSKQPVLLPNKHYFTDLVIVAHHASVHHDGIRETLNSVRERYWIVRGREAVKRVTRSCRVCRRYEGKPFVAQCFPQLPASRVSDAPPFTNTGIDFAGPLYVKSNRQVETEKHKAYVCLLTCASTRAVHLELVPSLTVSAFLQAFRRFVARRGLPARLLSDNAKTFKAAAKEFLKITRAREVKRYMADKGVEWKFIIEKSPWQGSFWERLVRSVKRCLKKVIGKAFLTFEELRTVLIEIEATINNRPLTYLYDDEQGVSYALTPSSLLYGRTIATAGCDRHYDIISTNQALTRREKHHRMLLKHFTNQ